jgi:hypothetical protein
MGKELDGIEPTKCSTMIQLFLNLEGFLPMLVNLYVVYALYLHVGFWNLIFLGSYLSLFVAIPFAYFFIESEGFAGSKKVTIFTMYSIQYLAKLLI